MTLLTLTLTEWLSYGWLTLVVELKRSPGGDEPFIGGTLNAEMGLERARAGFSVGFHYTGTSLRCFAPCPNELDHNLLERLREYSLFPQHSVLLCIKGHTPNVVVGAPWGWWRVANKVVTLNPRFKRYWVDSKSASHRQVRSLSYLI